MTRETVLGMIIAKLGDWSEDDLSALLEQMDRVRSGAALSAPAPAGGAAAAPPPAQRPPQAQQPLPAQGKRPRTDVAADSWDMSTPVYTNQQGDVVGPDGEALCSGVVKIWLPERGHGFVQADDGSGDIRVQTYDIQDGDQLCAGERVYYKMRANTKANVGDVRWCAYDVVGPGVRWVHGGMERKHARLSDIDTFVAQNQLDERTAVVLAELYPAVLTAVLERGPCTDARNPSAVIMGRIRDAEAAVPQDNWAQAQAMYMPTYHAADVGPAGLPMAPPVSGYAPAAAWGAPGGHFVGGPRLPRLPQLAPLPRPAPLAHIPAPAHGAHVSHIPVPAHGSQPASQRAPPPAGGGEWVLGEGRWRGQAYGFPSEGQQAEALNAFIERNGLDDRSRQCLSELTGAQLAEVIDRGDVSSARNPNAVLMSRIKTLGNIRAEGGGPTPYGRHPE